MPKGTLTKAHIIQAFAETNGYTYRISVEIVEKFLELIKQTIESGEDVLVSGFGKFIVKQKRERRGRNPNNFLVFISDPLADQFSHICSSGSPGNPLGGYAISRQHTRIHQRKHSDHPARHNTLQKPHRIQKHNLGPPTSRSNIQNNRRRRLTKSDTNPIMKHSKCS